MNTKNMILLAGVSVIVAVLLSCGCTSIAKIPDEYAKWKVWYEESIKDLPVIGTKTNDAKKYDHGRLVLWTTPQGKAVRQYEDGLFENGQWEVNTGIALPGAAQYYADQTGDQGILGKKILGTICKSTASTLYSGTYADDGSKAPVPEDTEYLVEIEGGYSITFTYGNRRDAIWSGNGVYWVNGPGGSVHLKANHTGDYKGMRTFIR